MDTEDPPLPPNPELLNRQPKWFKPVFYGCIVYGCIVAAILFGLADYTAPTVIRARKNGSKSEATNNAYQIGFALQDFEDKYGSFPSAATSSDVTTSHPSHTFKLSGISSNAHFRQLFAAQITQSEAMFYAEIKDSIKPDGITTPGKLLEKGEVGFSYISGLTSKDDPLTPIVLTPLILGTTKFDPKPLKGFAVVLYLNNSMPHSYKIAKDGHIYDDKGINLLSAKHPVWKGKAPDIRYPE